MAWRRRLPVNHSGSALKRNAARVPRLVYLVLGAALGIGFVTLLSTLGGSIKTVASWAGQGALQQTAYGLHPPAVHAELRDGLQEVEASLCGNWQARYARLHADILAGEAPQRYVVAGGLSGLADNLIGAVTAFLHALLTDRAFLLRMEYDTPRWEWGFMPWGINWTVPEPADPIYPKSVDFVPDPRYPLYDEGRHVAYFKMHLLYQDEGTEVLKNGNLSALAEEYETIYWQAAGGFTYHLFENKYVAPQLDALGLRQDTAFACVLRFLMQPTPEVRRLFAPEADALLRDSKALKIGIQIRLGDNHMMGGDLRSGSLQLIEPWLHCALEVENSRRTNMQQRVVYYLVSDSNHVREIAKSAFPDKILSPTNRPIGHILWRVHQRGVRLTEEQERLIFMTAVGEFWAFGLTDVQVTTAESGFGKLAALRSLRQGAQYQIHGRTARKCGIHDYDLYRDLATSWAGV